MWADKEKESWSRLAGRISSGGPVWEGREGRIRKGGRGVEDNDE